MRIGIPKEIKPLEGRVSLTPFACSKLVNTGHEVFIQSDAGSLSGFTDDAYVNSGVKVLDTAKALYQSADLIVKVKEPIAGDLTLLQEHHTLFSYLHLAPAPELVKQLQQIGLTAVAFETVQLDDGSLPLLEPMSVIAGRLAVQIGTHLLHAPMGGKGVLLGGLATTERGNVVVLGAGNSGAQAVDVAASLGANVTVFDLDVRKLSRLQAQYANVTAFTPTDQQLSESVANADLLIGAVLVAGLKAPTVVTEDMVKTMQKGSVIVDIAIDQGGCIETAEATDYTNPVIIKHGVQHFAVTNMPGAVPVTSSQALSASILPYVEKIAAGKLHSDLALAKGLNLQKGEVILPALL